MKSIISNEKQCFFCGRTMPLETHHVFEGTANRKISEKYGCTVYLCHEHHTGNTGVHFDKKKDLFLKRKAQDEWQKRYGDRDAFIRVFGKSYLI